MQGERGKKNESTSNSRHPLGPVSITPPRAGTIAVREERGMLMPLERVTSCVITETPVPAIIFISVITLPRRRLPEEKGVVKKKRETGGDALIDCTFHCSYGPFRAYALARVLPRRWTREISTTRHRDDDLFSVSFVSCTPRAEENSAA